VERAEREGEVINAEIAQLEKEEDAPDHGGPPIDDVRPDLPDEDLLGSAAESGLPVSAADLGGARGKG
jgi:hypothetical protein